MNEIFADSLTKKEVPQQDPSRDSKYQRYLYILRSLNSGLRPSQIITQLAIPKTTFQHYLDNLKRHGLISKIGYGVWELSGEAISMLQTSTTLTPCSIQQDPKEVPNTAQQNLSFFFASPDTIRAHAFVLTVAIPPHLRNWNNELRAKYLIRHNISFTELNIGGGGQRIIFQGRKVWLTDRSIVIYDRSSYLADTSVEAKIYAISKLLSLVKVLERLLHADFTFKAGREYRFKVSRQHYALVKNALAKQYDAEGKKLRVSNEDGLWFVIDNSYNLNEAETLSPKSAATDNVTIQNFFNALKTHPITSEFVLSALLKVSENQSDISKNQQMFAQNMLNHIKLIKDLGIGI